MFRLRTLLIQFSKWVTLSDILSDYWVRESSIWQSHRRKKNVEWKKSKWRKFFILIIISCVSIEFTPYGASMCVRKDKKQKNFFFHTIYTRKALRAARNSRNAHVSPLWRHKHVVYIKCMLMEKEERESEQSTLLMWALYWHKQHTGAWEKSLRRKASLCACKFNGFILF